MKKFFSTVLEYIPEFFMFAPIVVWIAAYLTNNPVLEDIFLRCWWWMFLGMTFSAIDIATYRSRHFL